MSMNLSVSHKTLSKLNIIVASVMVFASLTSTIYMYINMNRSPDIPSDQPNSQQEALYQAIELIKNKTSK